MFLDILKQAWEALRHHTVRSVLTTLGIIWGIVAVTILIAYGDGFRFAIVRAFEAFGRSAVICWPGQTSEQAGGQRAGRPIRFQIEDVKAIEEQCTLVKAVSPELFRRTEARRGDRTHSIGVRGVYPVYSEMRNEVPSEGRFFSSEDMLQHRRVVVLGEEIKTRLFGSSSAVGQTIAINGVRFLVIGTMEKKIQFSNYFTSDDNCGFIPFTTAGDIWNAKYLSVIVFMPVAPSMEPAAMEQVRAAVAKRQGFQPGDKMAMRMFGREQFRPVIDGITIGIEFLLTFIGILTLSIGSVGVMNIMLVSVSERTREIGIRRAMGATRRQILTQFLWEALVLTVGGGIIGMALSFAVAGAIDSLPFLGPMYEDASGKGDIHLRISAATLLLSSGILIVIGLLSGLFPAVRAARLDPVEALRYE
ncbi:MAG TPA: ABC transporter permease [Candidatus Acidoferrales bacterium]